MPQITDQAYLLHSQYKDAHNLKARIALHERFSTNRYGWHRWAFDQWETDRWPADARVLELGGGPGDVWRVNLERLQPRWRVTVSDFSPGMVDQARAQLGRDPRFEFAVIDAQHIERREAEFDVVIAHYMLYHVPDRPRALAEIVRVLKPQGLFVAATTGDGHMHELRTMIQSAYPGDDNWWASPIGFTLESGVAQLMPFFQRIDLRQFPDRLEVTEPEPLQAYVTASVEAAAANPAPIAALIRQAFEAHGGRLSIAKSSGLFRCTGPASP